MKLQSISVYPLIWFPETHGDRIVGDLFAVEPIEFPPGAPYGLTAAEREPTPAFVFKLSEECDARDALGNKVRATVDQAVRVPMRGCLERLRGLLFDANGNPSELVARIALVCGVKPGSHFDGGHFVQAYLVSDHTPVKRSEFKAPKPFEYDVIEAIVLANARAAAEHLENAKPPPPPVAQAVASGTSAGDTLRSTEQAPIDT